ncbi:MAG: hypothetical protein M9937_14810 [Chelatococcus sp.]|nr:hypothetical protein [Chelatococcus sp.]
MTGRLLLRVMSFLKVMVSLFAALEIACLSSASLPTSKFAASTESGRHDRPVAMAMVRAGATVPRVALDERHVSSMKRAAK